MTSLAMVWDWLHSLPSLGQRDLYPFAILFRELPVDRHEELIRRAMSWPDPLADQVARVLKR
jgi:hypothetical protein